MDCSNVFASSRGVTNLKKSTVAQSEYFEKYVIQFKRQETNKNIVL